MTCPNNRRHPQHGPRAHARPVSEKVLLAFGKPHHLSNLRWPGLQIHTCPEPVARPNAAGAHAESFSTIPGLARRYRRYECPSETPGGSQAGLGLK